MASSLRRMGFAIGFVFLGLLLSSACEARVIERGHMVPIKHDDRLKVPPQPICEQCLEFTNQVQMILADPETQHQAIEVVSQMACQSLIPQFKKKCVEMVGVYVPDIFVSLQKNLGPDLCTRAGICAASFPEDLSSSEISTSEASTSEIVTTDRSLEDTPSSHRARRHWRFLGHRFLGKKKMCKHGRRSAFEKVGVGMSDCAFCEFVVLELKLKLRDPLTQDKILEVLYNGCNRVQNHVDQCKMIVAEYAPFILANLDNILDADQVCAKIGACKPYKLHHHFEGRLDGEGFKHHHHFDRKFDVKVVRHHQHLDSNLEDQPFRHHHHLDSNLDEQPFRHHHHRDSNLLHSNFDEQPFKHHLHRTSNPEAHFSQHHHHANTKLDGEVDIDEPALRFKHHHHGHTKRDGQVNAAEPVLVAAS